MRPRAAAGHPQERAAPTSCGSACGLVGAAQAALERAAEIIEKDLTVLGATAIEDRLQAPA